MIKDGFIRGAARVVLTEGGREINSVSDILVMGSGDDKYDVRIGFFDFGFTRTGIMLDTHEVHLGIGQFLAPGYTSDVLNQTKVSTQLAEMTWDRLDELAALVDDRPTVIFLMQKNDQSIRSWIFYDCVRVPMEQPVDYVKLGESSAIPISWIFRSGRMIDQNDELDAMSNIITFTDFNEWRATLSDST